MQKTRLGITVGLMGSAVYLISLFGGYLPAIVLVGYVLLFEENAWLRKNAVRAIAVLVLFSLISTLIHFIPDLINFIDDVFQVFNGNFNVAFLNKIVNVLISALNIIEKVLLLVLGVKALNQGSVSVPVVDKLTDKYMG